MFLPTFFQASGLLKELSSCPIVCEMEGILKGRSVGSERPLQIRGVRMDRWLCFGCGDADDSDQHLVLFFVWWDGGLRGPAWEAVVGLGSGELGAWLQAIA